MAAQLNFADGDATVASSEAPGQAVFGLVVFGNGAAMGAIVSRPREATVLR